MKKLTKLVSAVAFVSALALVGCANPSSGAPTLPKISASDVQKPAGYDKASNPIKSAKDGRVIVEKVIQEMRTVSSAAYNYIEGTPEYDKEWKASSERMEQVEKDFMEFGQKVITNKESTTKTFSGYFTPGLYKNTDNNIQENVVEYVAKTTATVDFDKNFMSSKNELSHLYSLSVADASKIECDPKATVLKSLINNSAMKTSTTVEFEGDSFANFETADPTKESSIGSYTEEYYGFFDDGTNNGILKFNFSMNSKSGAEDECKVSVVFYDIDGKEQYSYSEAENNEVLTAIGPMYK